MLRNRSEYLIAAGTENAGHGLPLDLAVVDEAWAFKDYRLDESLPPAQRRPADPQLWIFSTAGTDESVYLRRWVELGRAFTAERLCYIEYSAGDGDDPADPATWARCTPALGVTIQPETIADEYATSPLGSFERFALNRWTHGVEHALPPAWWAACADPDAAPPPRVGRLEIGVDVAFDRSVSSIAVAGRRPDGVVVIELIEHRDGTEWLADRVIELTREWRPGGGPILNALGPAGGLSDTLDARHVPHRNVSTGDLADASAAMFGALRDGTVRHRAQPDLDASAAKAVRGAAGDRWRFKRSTTSSPLIAATLAHYGLVGRPVMPTTLVRSLPDPTPGLG